MPRSIRHPRTRRQPLTRLPGRLALLLAAALLLPGVQSAQAVDIYYARAIGQEYLPEARPPAGLPESSTSSSPDLPGLGDRAAPEEAPRPMSIWSKVLIGVVLVAAVAALGDGDGGAAQLNVSPGGSTDPGGSNAPPQGGSGGGSTPPSEPLPGAGGGDDNGGGGFIDVGGNDAGIDFDDRDDDDNRGRGRGRGRDRD